MKFGKHIQAQQVPGWAAYYLDYKFLKKIISSLAANRPASDAAALAVGHRPTDAPEVNFDASSGPPIFSASEHDEDRGPAFRAHKAAFFFKLERELEKINAFYLQKEAELKLRLETLLSKRRAAAMHGLPDSSDDDQQKHVEWNAVEEGFRLLERDLGKIQQFVEINATGFRKILKKYDKRSKSSTKELYLTRQVEVQPVFNRQLISELSDTVATCLLDLTDLSSGIQFEGTSATDIFTQRIITERAPHVGPFYDWEKNLRRAVSGNDLPAIKDCINYSNALLSENGGATNATRILWSVIIEAPVEIADLILTSVNTPFDFHFMDDINGRTCLHEAAISGTPRLVKLCLEKGVKADQVDVYGRTALHYAAMHGHAAVCNLLLLADIPPNTLDVDNHSPLLYATICGSVDCVRILLDNGALQVVPTSPPSTDLIPLSLASRSGHVDVVVILLQRGADIMPNTNGEYPMHLAAREGHAEVCRLLINREGWDVPDKYHEWTPLFHAARYGREECVRILIDARCRLHTRDELGHLAVHYAAWYGHHMALKYLLEAAASTTAPLAANNVFESSPSTDGGLQQSEIDLIPSITLPPPIMPHRVYGHNYLDRSHLVQVTVGKPDGSPGVELHHRRISPAFRDEYLITSSPLKLVMTTSPEVNSAPYCISLPERGDKGMFTFQIPSLSALFLEFSIYPNFGTKTIGRAVALPSLFNNLDRNRSFTLPILDHRLHVVGEVTFELNVISPFEGVTLEIGGNLETYWKSTAAVPAIHQALNSLIPRSMTSFLTTSAQGSPATQTISPSIGQDATISSLGGKYLALVVQVTRDFQPVVFSEAALPDTIFDLAVSDVTLDQFEAVAARLGRNPTTIMSASEWLVLSSKAMISLKSALALLPPGLAISLEFIGLTNQTGKRYYHGSGVDVNQYVDSVLRTIHSAFAHREARRGVVFTSLSPDVCAALNWKQPNYPTFFATRCGKLRNAEHGGDKRLLSVGAAVSFAHANNLLGVFVDEDLLLQVPSLINGIRNAGLLVGILQRTLASTPLVTPSDLEGSPVDAFGAEGMVVYLDHTMRDI